MKKIIAGMLTAATVLTSAGTFAPLCTPTFASFIVESDAQTAMEKNQQAILTALKSMTFSNSVTAEKFENSLMEQCTYSASSNIGAQLTVSNFKLTKATDSEPGLITADVVIAQNDGSVWFEVEKEIPALSGGTSKTPENKNTVTMFDARDMVSDAVNKLTFTNDTTSAEILAAAKKGAPDGATVSVKKEVSITKATDTEKGLLEITLEISLADGNSGDLEITKVIAALGKSSSDESTVSPKQEIAAAKKAINSAIWDLEVSNETTKTDILNMAKKVVSDNVTVTLADKDFSIVKSNAVTTGTVSATLTLLCGDLTDRVSVAKTIEKYYTEDAAKLEKDRDAASSALSAIKYDNTITKEYMLEVAQAAATHGTKMAWKDNFYSKKATFDEPGLLSGDLILTLNDETRELSQRSVIPQLVKKMPPNIKINKSEWRVLRLTNIERAKEGLKPLSMPSALQDACEIREKEVAESFSHTRPDGTKFNTAISESFPLRGAGENLHKCTPGHETPDRAVEGWMNSPGHRANILTSSYGYLGVGMDGTSAVQIFGIPKGQIISVTSSTGQLTFDTEESMLQEYLILTSSDGIVSYLPLDESYVKQNGSQYTLDINAENPVVLTVGSASAEPSVSQSITFSDVRHDAYYANAVKWAVEKNITVGTTATTFSPDDTCTRAQILTFLWRAVGSPKATAKNPFSDISASDYFYDAAIWASENGMVTGSKFEGNTPCTRASTVTYMWKNAGAPQTDISNKFNDVASGSDYAEAVAWAVKTSVTSGTSDTEFSPDTICSRGQIVTFLNRALNK